MIKQVIVVDKNAKMSKGKMGAQVGHAAVCSFINAWNKDSEITDEWLDELMIKIVLEVPDVLELKKIYYKANQYDIPCFLVADAGKTEVAPGTITCLGLGPWDSDEINLLTGHLKLYTDEEHMGIFDKIVRWLRDTAKRIPKA